MNLLLTETVEPSNNTYIWIILGVIVFLLVVFLLYRNRKKKPKVSKIIVNKDLINDIREIFTKENTLTITSDVSRVRFTVKDIEKLNLDKLKQISNGVFISQNNVKVMFKDSADEIVKELEKYYY